MAMVLGTRLERITRQAFKLAESCSTIQQPLAGISFFIIYLTV